LRADVLFIRAQSTIRADGFSSAQRESSSAAMRARLEVRGIGEVLERARVGITAKMRHNRSRMLRTRFLDFRSNRILCPAL
jgi:hypothetical protein